MELIHQNSSAPIKEFLLIAEKLALTNYFIDEDGMLDQKVLVARGFAKIMFGFELGLSPMYSMQHVNIIKGKMTLDAGGVASLIDQSTIYNYKIISLTDSACEISFTKNNELLGTIKWTVEDAKKANLYKEGGAWAKYTKDLLFARAITAGARRYTPGIFGGSIYTPEELQTETEASFTIESPPQEPFTDKERKNLHALGSIIYGDEWDDKRRELVEFITNGRTSSSSEISRSEMMDLIQGMKEKQKQSIPETFQEPVLNGKIES